MNNIITNRIITKVQLMIAIVNVVQLKDDSSLGDWATRKIKIISSYSIIIIVLLVVSECESLIEPLITYTQQQIHREYQML